MRVLGSDSISLSICEMISETGKLVSEIRGSLKATEALKSTLTASSKLPAVESMMNLIVCMEEIVSMHNDVDANPSLTLIEVADICQNHASVHEKLQVFDSQIPTPSEISKFESNRKFSRIIEEINKTGGIENWIKRPFVWAASWERFWVNILQVLPSEDHSRSVFQKCKNYFHVMDRTSLYQRNATKFKNQLKELRNAWRLDTDLQLQLLYCAEGDQVLYGKSQNLEYLPSKLFIFSDRIVLLRGKTVTPLSKLSVWLVKSPRFPRDLNIVDVLGTEYSFAFKPKSNLESDNLWKHWNEIAGKAPSDFGIFQNVSLSLELPEDDLPWW